MANLKTFSHALFLAAIIVSRAVGATFAITITFFWVVELIGPPAALAGLVLIVAIGILTVIIYTGLRD